MNALPSLKTISAQEVVEEFLAGKTLHTVEAYRRDLRAFASYMGGEPVEAFRTLLGGDHGAANRLVSAYRASLSDSGLSPATINRRLAATRSLVAFARTIGHINWALDVKGLKVQAYRDTRGPSREEVGRIIASAQHPRDRAIVRLLYDLALRRGEVSALDMKDYEGDRIWVLRKGKSDPLPMTLPPKTKEALDEWIHLRGDHEGAMFTNFDRAGKGHRLTGKSINNIVKKAGSRVGVQLTAHGLRHSAITTALDLTGGNVRRVQQYSGHAEVSTVLTYDDNRRDGQGELARKVSDSC